MTFEEWMQKNNYSLSGIDGQEAEFLMGEVWNYQQERIDELEQWVAAIADEHPQIPDWIQQSARSLLAQEQRD